MNKFKLALKNILIYIALIPFVVIAFTFGLGIFIGAGLYWITSRDNINELEMGIILIGFEAIWIFILTMITLA